MLNIHNKFIFLFFKVVTPVLVIIFIFSAYLFDIATSEKKTMLLEKAIVVSQTIASIAKRDSSFESLQEFYRDSKKETILHIQSIFKKLEKKSVIKFKYFLISKAKNEIEFLAYSDKKPKNIQINDKNNMLVTKVLETNSGVEVGFDEEGKKVFFAYIQVEDTPWRLIISQSYDEHIEPFKKITIYMIIAIIIVLTFLYKLLSYFERKNTKLIQESEQRFKSLVESTDNWVWEVDTNGIYTYLSDQIEKVLGYSANEIIGKSPFSMMNEDEAKRVGEIFSNILKNQETIENLETKNIAKNGSEVTLLTNGTPFFSSTGELLGYRGIDKDVTELKSKQKEVEQLAYYDPLTSLANRKTISMRIDEEISFAQRNGIVSALLFMDLDGFKYINDSLGHEHGDKVLKEVALRLKSCTRDFDIASRIGGDEFMILVRGKEKDCERCKKHLNGLIKRVISEVNKPINIDDEVNHIGVSIGIAFVPQDGDNADELIKRADSAMYKAKNLGKNRAIFYDKDLQEEADRNITLKNDLINAFESDEFVMYYQPKYNIKTKEIVGYEALVRWMNKEKGLLLPSEFLPYIDKFTLNLQLDRYICNKVYEELYKLKDNFVQVSINLSEKSFEDKEFLSFVESRIDKGLIDTSKVTLEIKEETLIKDMDTSIIDTIKELGFKLSIDEFGISYSSLEYLSKIEFDEVKLNKSFIASIDDSEKNSQICKMILNMSSQLGIDVVAVGVETESQLNFVEKEGATVVQGYLYSKPLTLEELLAKI